MNKFRVLNSQNALPFRLLANHLWTTALDALFPPRCVACGHAGSLFCSPCQDAIPIPAIQYTPGSPLAAWRATADFGGAVRTAIHALKYENQRRMAEPLSQRLTHVLRGCGWQPAIITAMPLHDSRRHERGYNQSALLAERVAAACGVPFQPGIVRRTRATRPQVGLNAQERRCNVADAFTASDVVRGKAILIIDDVVTTGATMTACAQALCDAGAQSVWGLAVASAHLAAHNGAANPDGVA